MKHAVLASNEDESKEVDACLHEYCKSCIEAWLAVNQECPMCRLPLKASQLEPSKKTTQSIGGLEVRCPFRARGCTWQNTFGKEGKRMIEHVAECGHVVAAQCAHGCGNWFMRKDMQSHEATCDWRMDFAG